MHRENQGRTGSSGHSKRKLQLARLPVKGARAKDDSALDSPHRIRGRSSQLTLSAAKTSESEREAFPNSGRKGFGVGRPRERARTFPALAAILLGLFTFACAIASALDSVPVPVDQRSDSPPAEDESNRGALQEIIVTARRKSENLQTVPISVTAFSSDEIQKKNLVGPEDLNYTVPSLSTTNQAGSANTTNYTIRGQSQTINGGDVSVATYFDEVPTIAIVKGLFFDLASLEVLKGPQGTLFGRNTTGGAILLVPQHPTDEFGGYATLTMGDYNHRREQGAINTPIIEEKVFARFAFDVNRTDGYTKDAVTGAQYDDLNYQAYRFGLLIRSNDRVENYSLYNYITTNTSQSGLETLNVNPGGLVAFLYPGSLQAAAQQRAYGPRVINPYLKDGFSRVRDTALDNTTTIKLTDHISIKNILGYRLHLERDAEDLLGIPINILTIPPLSGWTAGYGLSGPSDRAFTEEMQFSGDAFSQRLSWTAGLYYETRKPANDDDFDGGFFFGSTLFNRTLARGNSKAVYGQANFKLTDQLTLTAGARYTKDTRSQVATQYYTNLFPCGPGLPPPPAGLGYCNVSESAQFHAPTGNISLQYQVSPDTMYYIASRRGYKSGGFNIAPPSPSLDSFQPEYVTDVEVGEKTEWHVSGVTARVNAALYRTWFKGWQELTSELRGTTAYTFIENTGEGVIQGAELEGTIIPSRNWELSAFYNYADPYYTRNIISGVNLVHAPFASTPKHKFSLTARYLLPTTRIGDFSASATYSYETDVYDIVALIPNDTDPGHRVVPAHGLLNLRADWTGAFGSSLDVGAYITNSTQSHLNV